MPSVLTKPPEPGETVIRRTETTTYEHRRAWLPWIIGLALVPLAIAALYLWPFGGRDKIQDDLSQRARESLAAASIPAGIISFDGNKGAICGVPPNLLDRARSTVQGLSGVGTVQVNASNCPAVGGPGAPSSGLNLAVQDGTLVLRGMVPTEAAKAEVAALAAAGGQQVDNQLTVQEGVTLPVENTAAGQIAAALAETPGDKALEFDGTTVTLTGSVPSEADKTSIGDRIGQLAPDLTVNNQLTVAAAPLATAKAELQQQINALQQRLPITFEPDSAVLTAAGTQSVQQIGVLLLAGPQDTAIEVNGHVAAVESPSDGQTLSQERADAVKEQLAAQGVAIGGITATGFGDTDPVATNDTPEGQALNRRVEIIVR
jgi:OOP family OmpA-OmpF porin